MPTTILYKYLSADYGLEALQRKRFKVSQLADLNDPSDCNPILINTPKTGGREQKANFNKQYLRTIYHRIGLISFSSKWDEPLLWSHYADAHRGMALGYMIPDTAFAPKGPFHEVSYTPERATIDFEEAEKLKDGGKIADAFLNKIIPTAFTNKSESWKYESEFRLFYFLESCSMVGSLYFSSQRLLKRPTQIILGNRCKLTAHDVLNASKRLGAPIATYRSRLHAKQHKLEIESILPA